MKRHSPVDNTFGPRLASLRQAAGLSQRAFAAAVGLSQRMVAYWERPSVRPPPADLLAKMAAVLGVTMDDLLGLSEPMPDRRVISRPLMDQLLIILKLPPRARRCALAMIRGLALEYGLAVGGEASPLGAADVSRPSTRARRRRAE